MTIQVIFEWRQRNGQLINKTVDDLTRVRTAVKAISDAGGRFDPNEFLGGADATRAVQSQINALTQVEQKLKQAGAAAAASGKQVAAMNFLQQANEVSTYRNSLEQLIDTQEKGDVVTRVLNSSFNKFGFTLFITISTIRQVTQALDQMFTAAQEGAGASDRIETFNQLMAQSGIDAQKLTEGMREAAQGAVKLSDAVSSPLRLIKAGFPEIAARSDDLLRIATNAAIVSGEIENTQVIYDKLVRGIVRGSPRLIDDADIVLKLGDAYEEYAASLGKSSDELDRAEQVQATFNAVIAEGERINELAEGIDSSSVALQALRTDAEEAGEVLKIALADTLTGLLEQTEMSREGFREWAQTTFDLSDEAADKFTELLTTFRGFASGVVAGGAGVIAFFSTFKTEVVNAIETIKDPIAFLLSFPILLRQELERTGGDFTQAMLNVNKQFQQTIKNVSNLDETFNPLEASLDSAEQATTEWLKKFGFLPEATQEVNMLTDALDNAADSMQNMLGEDLSALEESFSRITDPLSDVNIARELRSKRLDVEEDFADRMTDINEALAEKLLDIRENLNDKLAALDEKLKEDIAATNEDLAEKLTDINEDLADKIDKIRSDADSKTESRTRSHKKKLETIESDHQSKIAEILTKFEMSRLKALIDRDARALFEAQQTRDQDLKSAEETAKEKRETELEEFKEKLEEIKKAEQERLNLEIKAAAKRRAEALKAAQKRLNDLKKRHADEKAEAIKAAREQQQDARQNFERQREDALESYRDRLQDLREWHDEMLQRQKEAAIKRRIQMLKDLEEEGKLTREHLEELQDLIDDFESGEGGDSGGGGRRGDIDLPGSGRGGGGGTRAPLPPIGGGFRTFQPETTQGQSLIPQTQSTPPPTKVTIQPSGDSMFDEAVKAKAWEVTLEAIQESR